MNLGISTSGNRKRHHKTSSSKHDDTIEQTTQRVLKQVESQSSFFQQGEPYTLPTFDSDEIEQGELLGQGEYGDVWEVKNIHTTLQFDPSDFDGLRNLPHTTIAVPLATIGDAENESLSHDAHPPLPPPPTSTTTATATTMTTMPKEPKSQSLLASTRPPRRASSPAEIVVDGLPSSKLQGKSGTLNGGGGGTSSLSIPKPSAIKEHKRAISQVSFAENIVKQSTDGSTAAIVDRNPTLTSTTRDDEDDDGDDYAIGNNDSDNSTLSTEDEEESVTNLLDDEDDTDGERTFLKGYMSTHVTRQGIARYAIKRPRKDLDPEALMEAVVDLAVEAKFLATVRHPNIVKMRGTVGTPGTIDFCIVMDRLKLTLRQKMHQWNDELKGKRGGILGKLLRHGGNPAALQREQHADKLLGVFDIARAMRYLHNHHILYRDLKPENVAFDVRGDCRLFDFGLVKELKAKDLVEPPDGFQATGLTGSRRYMAPEVVSCKHYGLKADVYSFAIVFWEVFSGQEAYAKMTFDKHFDQVVMKSKRPSIKAVATNSRKLSKSLLHLMPEMWSANPRDRPTFLNICDRLSGECILSSKHPRGGASAVGGGGGTRDSDQSHQSYLTDRTRYLMNRSLRSRYAADVRDSVGSIESQRTRGSP